MVVEYVKLHSKQLPYKKGSNLPIKSKAREDISKKATKYEKCLWPELSFPPLNLLNIYPTEEALAIHAKYINDTMGELWSKELNS